MDSNYWFEDILNASLGQRILLQRSQAHVYPWKQKILGRRKVTLVWSIRKAFSGIDIKEFTCL